MAACFKMAAILLTVALVSAQESASKVKFESSTDNDTSSDFLKFLGDTSKPNVLLDGGVTGTEGRGVRQGKDLFDLIGFGTGLNTDPYLAKTNSLCLEGDLSECFKSRALSTLDDFFDKEVYRVTENARVVRMPETQLRSLDQEPYEYSGAPRSDEPEWDQFVKFVLRKVEKFMKSAAIEVQFPSEVTEHGRYSPRFIDEIASEVDILEDKTATKKSRLRLKKLLIPLLVILKLFKLKLLLFLPLILGLASFKKLLGFLAIVIPGLIGFFKLCKPNLQGGGLGGLGGGYGHSNYYSHQPPHTLHQYSPGGLGASSFYGQGGGYQGTGAGYYGGNNYGGNNYARDADAKPSTHSGSVAFRDSDQATPDHFDAQQLAYNGYKNYQT